MKSAPRITLTDAQRDILTRWSRGRKTPVRLMQRARIVLLAAEGKMNKDIAAEFDIMPNTVVRWRGRFATGGLAAMPLFQVSQCETFQRQVLANVANNLPATLFQIMQSFALLPIQFLLGGGQVDQAAFGGI